MDTSYRKIFHGVTMRKPHPELHQKIMARVEEMQKRKARIRFWSLSSVSLVSLLAFIPAFQYFASAFVESGAYQYITLAFSNNGAFLPYWKEITFSIVESLPIFAVILLLSVLFTFVLSSVSAVRNAQKLSFQFN